MKVALINSVVDFGSTGRIVREISNGLKDAGHETRIYYGRFPSQNKTNTFYFGNKIGFILHSLQTRLLARHGLGSTFSTYKMIRDLDKYQPDVIHLHNIHGYYLNVKVLFNYLKKLDNVKIFWTHHDCWSFSGNSAYFDYHGIKEWNEGCVECKSIRDYPSTFYPYRQKRNFRLKRDLFTSVKNLIHVTPSQWLNDLMQDTFHSKYPIVTIRNGIDLSIFKPTADDSIYSKYKIDREKKILLGVSNKWENRKGLDVFVELQSKLNDDEQIVLVGLNSQQIAALPNGIIGIERTQNVQELASLYSAAHLYLNPTYEDNYPTTNLESIACGTPVISFATGGSGENFNEKVGLRINDKTALGLRLGINSFVFSNTTNNDCLQFARKNSDKIESNYQYIKLLTENY